MTAVGITSHPSFEVIRLQQAIADALAAMDRGEYGAARQILRTGRDTTLKAVTSVLAKGQ